MNERLLATCALLSLFACANPVPGSQPPPADAPPPESGPPQVAIDAATLPIDPRFWEKGDAVCPDGGRIGGAPPPGSTLVYCELDGKTHGPVAIFDDEGRMTHLANEVRGEYDGVAIDFWPTGAKKKETHYVAGKMHGPVTGFHPDGSKAFEGTNVDDEAEGTFRGFDASGKEVGKYEMKRGNGRLVQWHPNGRKAYEVEMVGGREQGLATTWRDDGTKAMEEHYVDARRTGAYAEWDERGGSVKGTFADEREEGEWIHRDAGGSITRVDRWSDGDLVASIAYEKGRPLAKGANEGACATEKGLAKAFAAQTGGTLDDGYCIERSVHFPGAIAIGNFGHDRGCAAGGVMVDCRWRATPDGDAILKRAGWRRASDAAREAMVKNYVAEIAEPFGGDDDPSIEHRADRTWVVRMGMSTGPLMNGETPHWTVEYRVTKKGDVTRVEND